MWSEWIKLRSICHFVFTQMKYVHQSTLNAIWQLQSFMWAAVITVILCSNLLWQNNIHFEVAHTSSSSLSPCSQHSSPPISQQICAISIFQLHQIFLRSFFFVGFLKIFGVHVVRVLTTIHHVNQKLDCLTSK